jgi:hypothetical protein
VRCSPSCSARTSALRSNDAVRPRQTRTGPTSPPDRAAALRSRQAASSHAASPCEASASPPSPSTRGHARRPRTLPLPHATSVYRVRSHRNAAARGQLHASLRTPLLSPNRRKKQFLYCSDKPPPLDHTKLPNPTATKESPSQRWRGADGQGRVNPQNTPR